MSVSSFVNITELIDRCPLGPLQIRVIVLCGLVALLDGFDLLAIGVAAPVMAGPLHIAPNQFSFVFSVALVGLMLGAFGLGPIADRYGRRCVLIYATATFGVFTLCTASAQRCSRCCCSASLPESGWAAQCQASPVWPRNTHRDQTGRR